MKYTVLIYVSPEELANRANPEYFAPYAAYAQAMREAEVMVDGSPLEAPGTAKTFTRTASGDLVQDGPYADIKEQLGGFFVIEAPDLDAALTWATRCPAPPGCALEVRPNLVLN